MPAILARQRTYRLVAERGQKFAGIGRFGAHGDVVEFNVNPLEPIIIFGVAALYVFLAADFVAGAQFLIYMTLFVLIWVGWNVVTPDGWKLSLRDTDHPEFGCRLTTLHPPCPR